MPKKPMTPEAMRLRMADLCSRSEQCEADIREKLRKAGVLSRDAEDILDFLKREKFIDNTRFAAAFARDKARFAGWGVHKIRLHLAAKRISSADIRSALDSIDRKEYIEALKRAGIAKARSLDLSKREDAAKFYRHIISRGYETDLAAKLLQALRRRQSSED